MFLSFSEAWLDCDTPDGVISIPGYRVHRRNRCGRGGGVAAEGCGRGGDVAIYCPDGSKCKRKEDL